MLALGPWCWHWHQNKSHIFQNQPDDASGRSGGWVLIGRRADAHVLIMSRMSPITLWRVFSKSRLICGRATWRSGYASASPLRSVPVAKRPSTMMVIFCMSSEMSNPRKVLNISPCREPCRTQNGNQESCIFHEEVEVYPEVRFKMFGHFALYLEGLSPDFEGLSPQSLNTNQCRHGARQQKIGWRTCYAAACSQLASSWQLLQHTLTASPCRRAHMRAHCPPHKQISQGGRSRDTRT